jgi:hypothetical protein
MKLYETDKYVKLLRAQLSKYREENEPRQVGRSSQLDILRQLRPEILAMTRDQYGRDQLVEALRCDTFQVLPRMITQILREHDATKQKKRTRASKAGPKDQDRAQPVDPAPDRATATSAGGLTAESNRDLFQVKADRETL